MASGCTTSDPDGNGPNGDKERDDKSSHLTPLETLASVAVAAAAPAITPTVEPPTMEAEEPTVQNIEDIGEHTGHNTGDNAGDNTGDDTDDITEDDIHEAISQVMHQTALEGLQFAISRTSTSGNGEGSSSAPAYRQHDCIVARTVNRHAPYLADVPDIILGQVWIDHIDSMIGVRTQSQTDEMRFCIEHTDRIIQLANDVLRRQRELLADLRRISSEIMGFGDKEVGSGDGDDTVANGRSIVEE
ncbi:hypothetical protein N7453_003100 [Penicillium expansum]|nr:hypothetical protein N7453_003100 [Penicillium expansum]